MLILLIYWVRRSRRSCHRPIDRYNKLTVSQNYSQTDSKRRFKSKREAIPHQTIKSHLLLGMPMGPIASPRSHIGLSNLWCAKMRNSIACSRHRCLTVFSSTSRRYTRDNHRRWATDKSSAMRCDLHFNSTPLAPLARTTQCTQVGSMKSIMT